MIKPVHIPALKIPPTISHELSEMPKAIKKVSNHALFCFIFDVYLNIMQKQYPVILTGYSSILNKEI